MTESQKKETSIVEELSLGLVNMVWKGQPPQFPIDISVRTISKSNLYFIVSQQIGSSSSKEEATKKLLTVLEEDKSYREKVINHIKSCSKKIKEHYTRFGGKSALLAYFLLLSILEGENEETYLAKVSLLNWYAEQRSIDKTLLCGGCAGAWWPFEWFGAHFDAIAEKVIASAIYAISANLLKREFMNLLNKIKSNFAPYPDEILIAKSPETSLQDFEKQLDECGLKTQYLYIFNLDEEPFQVVIDDITKAIWNFFPTLSNKENETIEKLIEGPMAINITESNDHFFSLRERGIVKFIEMSPNEISAVIYPLFFQGETMEK